MIVKFQADVVGQEDTVVEVTRGADPAGDIWATLWGWNVHLIRTDEGIVVDVWGDGVETDNPLASTYAFDQEREDAHAAQ